jgi:general secretion pathway protein G
MHTGDATKPMQATLATRLMHGARASRRGFSLLELMLVVAIIGILMGVLIVNLGGAGQKAQVGAAKAQLKQIKGMLETYFVSEGSYPSTEQGLIPLVTTKAIENTNDPWKRPYRYASPSVTDPTKGFDLISVGPDGQPGTSDDINVWTMDGPSNTNQPQ